MNKNLLLDYLNNLKSLEEERIVLITLKDRVIGMKNRVLSTLQNEDIAYSPPKAEYVGHTGPAVGIVFGVLLGVLCIISIPVSISRQESLAPTIPFSLLAIFLIVFNAFKYRSRTETNDGINRSIQNYESDYNYQKERIKKENIHIRRKANSIDTLIDQIDLAISSKNAAISKMYASGIIHHNYQNYYSVSKIYDLLDTGICDELTGPTGAYAQIRIDNIVDNQKITNTMLMAGLSAMESISPGVSAGVVKIRSLLNNSGYNMNPLNGLEKMVNDTDIPKFIEESLNGDSDVLSQMGKYNALVG